MNIADVSGEVTFNVKITDATGVTFDVKITDATGVTFDVKITDATGVTFDVKITDASGVTFDVNIAKVDSAVTFKVNIANVESGVTFNVKITDASGVTFNVQTEAGVVLNVHTPSGKWVSASDLLSSVSTGSYSSIASGSEEELVSIPDTPPVRGRIKAIGFYVVANEPAVNFWPQIRLRVYVDGESDPSVDLSFREIDLLNGGVIDAASMHGFNRHTDSLGRYWMYATAVSPRGAVTYAGYDPDVHYYFEAGAFLVLDIEFTSSVSIRVYNGSNKTIGVTMVVLWGEYL